jgi:hypothetical protein
LEEFPAPPLLPVARRLGGPGRLFPPGGPLFRRARERYTDNDDNVVTTGTTEPIKPGDAGNAVRTAADARRWRDAGAGFCGSTIREPQSKIGYLGHLVVAALWVSPVLKQVPSATSDHGYGIQKRRA